MKKGQKIIKTSHLSIFLTLFALFFKALAHVACSNHTSEPAVRAEQQMTCLLLWAKMFLLLSAQQEWKQRYSQQQGGGKRGCLIKRQYVNFKLIKCEQHFTFQGVWDHCSSHWPTLLAWPAFPMVLNSQRNAWEMLDKLWCRHTYHPASLWTLHALSCNAS